MFISFKIAVQFWTFLKYETKNMKYNKDWSSKLQWETKNTNLLAKSKMEILSNLVAFSNNTNFKKYDWIYFFTFTCWEQMDQIFLMNQLLLKKEPGIFAIQNTISTMLRMLIPVNKPSVPPRIKEKYKTTIEYR